MNMFTRARGFTLIELLVVIAIIGVLASTVLAAVGQSRVAARDAKRMQEAKQLQNALELYRNANGGSYPCAENAAPPTTVCPATPVVVWLNDGNIAAGGALNRRENLKADLQPYIQISNDEQLSGSAAGAYPNVGSLHYLNDVGNNGYTITVYRESGASCTLTHNGGTC